MTRLMTAISRGATVTAPIVSLVGLVILWEVWARTSDTPSFLLPRASDVFSYIVDNRGLLWDHARSTITAAVLGFILALIFGISLSVAMVWSRMFEASVYPIVVMTQVIPKIAIAPLLVVYMGFGIAPKIFLAFLVSFFPIVINTTLGLKSVKPDLIYLLASLKATKGQVFRKVRIQNAMPYIVEGAKIASALAVIGAIVGEFMSGSSGLGYLINASTISLNTIQGFGSLVILVIVGVVLFEAVQFGGKLLTPWVTREEP